MTTIVSAAILLIFGTGPVKGFATTLIIGLFANLFTVVFVSRVIFDWVLISEWIRNTPRLIHAPHRRRKKLAKAA